MNGFLVVDKPVGMTSHDVVARVRRLMNLRKVGHTGTLDPFATGVLPVAVGEATKAIQYLDESVKEYRATMVVGVDTDTLDATGQIVAERGFVGVTPEAVREAAAAFIGEILQVPPMFSALKRNGVPLYKLARRGEEVEREARKVVIHSLEISSVDLPTVEFVVRCSRGTYVRTLAADLGERLGCGAHLIALRRTISGIFTLGKAVCIEEIGPAAVASAISIDQALAHLPEVALVPEAARKVMNGMSVPATGSDTACAGTVRLTSGGKIVAVGKLAVGETGVTCRPERVFTSFSFT